MKIEHFAMFVKDLDESKSFFEKYFDGHAGELYHNRTTGFQSYFISFDDGARLELMTRPDMTDSEKEPVRTGYNHIALSVGSKEKVDTLTERLKIDGFSVISGPRTTGDGYYESCIVDFEGDRIEITE